MKLPDSDLLSGNLHKLLAIIMWIENDWERFAFHLKLSKHIFDKIKSTLG